MKRLIKLEPSRGSLSISAASIDALKWLAMVLMVVDHANKYVLKETVPSMYAAGRIAMPLFMFVLGYNLSRPGALLGGVYKRILTRLLVFGAIATPPFLALNTLTWNWWPVNIMFAMGAAVLVAWLIDRGDRLSVICACLVFFWGGALVEFWWPAVALCLFSWAYFKKPSVALVVGFIVSLLLLYFVNGNFWALGVLPIIVAARLWRWPLPRLKWFFYAFYPAHLAILWVCVRSMGGI